MDVASLQYGNVMVMMTVLMVVMKAPVQKRRVAHPTLCAAMGNAYLIDGNVMVIQIAKMDLTKVQKFVN